MQMQHHETSYADDNMDFQMKDDVESLSNEGNQNQNHIETEYAEMEDAAEGQPDESSNLNRKSPSKGEQKQLESKTLRWYMPIIGEVPMSK